MNGMDKAGFRSGFVGIYGFANVGKSTLLNALTGEKIAIVSPRMHSTRRRVQGLYNTDNVQIVFSDTPGWIDNPYYLLHHKMIDQILSANEDGDVSLVLVEPKQSQEQIADFLVSCPVPAPRFLLLNKAERAGAPLRDKWKAFAVEQNFCEFFCISAKRKTGLDELLARIIRYLPEGQPFYDTDLLCVQPQRFLAEEMIREKIFLLCEREIPYHTGVVVQSFKDDGKRIVIFADIFVQRETQKKIILGKNGEMIKQIGMHSRVDMQAFFRKSMYLDLSVRVRKNWRADAVFLKKLGYSSSPN